MAYAGTGGFVLRRFEHFTTTEVRTWWINGTCGLIGSHRDTPNDLPPADVDLTAIAPLVAASGLPFVSVDLALRADGVWRVVELGDGQVSDRPTSVDPTTSSPRYSPTPADPCSRPPRPRSPPLVVWYRPAITAIR